MAKKVKIEKVAAATKLTVYYTDNPNEKKVYLLSTAILQCKKGVVKILGTPISFKLSDLEDDYGAENTEQFINQIAIRNLFTPTVANSTGFINYQVLQNSSIVQSDLLIGKQSIDLVLVAGIPNQNITGYDSETGSFNFDVSAGEHLTIFFTN